MSSNSSTGSLNNKSTKSKNSLKSTENKEKSTPSPSSPRPKDTQDKKKESPIEEELEVWDLVYASSEDAESIPERIQEQIDDEEEDSEDLESEKRENPTALSPIKSNFVLQRSYSKTDFLFYYYY